MPLSGFRDPAMEELLLDIVRRLRADPQLDARGLSRIVNAHSTRMAGDVRFAKKQILPWYLRMKAEDPARWRSWGIDRDLEQRLIRLVQVKPRRTASGVATITVIMKPWACSGSCVFCPSDVRMPKSYLHAEPACQRAERNWFDPYLQVSARMQALMQMGHATDKVELIVLGGTFCDYPPSYRIWFVKELFRALNDAVPMGEDACDAPLGDAVGDDACADTPAVRAARYRMAGISVDDAELAERVRAVQARVTEGGLSFNEAVGMLYGKGSPWEAVSRWQHAGMDELVREHRRNEGAAHRCVGLSVETRPDRASLADLVSLRELGCTKVQVGVQTLQPSTISCTGRGAAVDDARRTFALLRLLGFKVHAHFMVNLPGATPERDLADYRDFMASPAFQPDEVKLYPCALIASAPLARLRDSLGWRPYGEEELVGVLAAEVLSTPAYTRISRMIRDFSAADIVEGNKKANLRQLVEERLRAQEAPVREIRYREIGTGEVDAATLTLRDEAYRTETGEEHFLQWCAPDGRIAGFLRLSLPSEQARAAAFAELGEAAPVKAGEAMIREVHVYGRVARLEGARNGDGQGAVQHIGLGRQLVERAEEIARKAGYAKVNVISAVGTRGYYRKLGFADNGLYQQRDLGEARHRDGAV